MRLLSTKAETRRSCDGFSAQEGLGREEKVALSSRDKKGRLRSGRKKEGIQVAVRCYGKGGRKRSLIISKTGYRSSMKSSAKES